MKSKMCDFHRLVSLLAIAILFSSSMSQTSAQDKGATTGVGQNQAGSISGTLTDSAGAVLRGAQVSIPAKGMILSTDEQGRFFFSGLQPGDYAVSVSYIGFQKLTKTVTVNSGESTTVSLQLQVESAKSERAGDGRKRFGRSGGRE